jgi:CheY-like chemotaxis protein
MAKGKLLIVEDEPIVAMDLRQELSDLGYEVIGLAESADEALAIVQSTTPDCALMDIRIAGSMDGIQTARTLRHWFRVPSVFLTAHSDDTTLARAARAMPYGYLTKPFKREELKATLQMAMERARAEAEERETREEVAETFDGMMEGVLTLSCKGVVRFMNHAAELFAGWSAAKAKGLPAADVLRWSAAQTNPIPDLSNWAEAMEGEWLGCGLDLPGGYKSFVDVGMASLVDGNGEHRGFVLTLKDARERMRRQATEELHGERPFFDRAPIAMIQLDAQGRIERVNEALLMATGIPADQVLGRSLTALNLDPDPRIAKELIPKLLKEAAIIAPANRQAPN